MKKILFIIFALFACAVRADNTITAKSYVDTAAGGLQEQIGANDANTVLTYTDTAGTVGEKAIYDSSESFNEQTDALVTAGAFNTAVQNALETEFVCIERQAGTGGCLLYQIRAPYQQSKNLFDKNNLQRIHGWFSRNGSDWLYISSGYSIRIPCKPNTTYTARYNGDSIQDVLNLGSIASDDIPTESHPAVPCTNSIRFTVPTKDTYVTITTGPNDKWLIVQYNIAEPQNMDMANNLQIEEGAVATPYQPYGENTYLPQAN